MSNEASATVVSLGHGLVGSWWFTSLSRGPGGSSRRVRATRAWHGRRRPFCPSSLAGRCTRTPGTILRCQNGLVTTREPLVIGMLGGMSWESTAEYYRLINETVRTRL